MCGSILHQVLPFGTIYVILHQVLTHLSNENIFSEQKYDIYRMEIFLSNSATLTPFETPAERIRGMKSPQSFFRLTLFQMRNPQTI